MSSVRKTNFTSNVQRPLDGTEWVAIQKTPETNPTPTGTLTQDIANLVAQTPIAVNAQTGTTYTLALGDAGKIVDLNNASAITLTVPPYTDVDFEIGTLIGIVQSGAGAVTVAAGSGVTINSLSSALGLSGRYGVATLRKTAANTWHLFGGIQ
ncbi:MAG: hypothetical protein E6R03_12490 [Hyphomicrobiaceae bacterium]|nr:MAG: hypothetical protein E6R03_12490 [Hyphomicrobiaceae bacterium]